MIVGLLALLPAGPAWAQDATPSPKELWEAYPLDPGQAAPTVTATATPARPAADKGGMPLAVPIGLAALLAFAAGVGLGRRRRERAAAALEVPPAPQPWRFEWRDYPPPARPAPPPPPVPQKERR